jgi:DNA-directed RNA polymerase sigma subunit (sigma70/sigma32)
MQDHINRNTGPVRLPSTTAHRHLARWGTRLFDEARRDCQRERVPATETELCTRVGRRIGLSADEVARSRVTQTGATVAVDMLSGFGSDADGEDHAAEDSVIRRLDHEKLRRRVLALAESVLGERERAVFLARCMTGNRPVVQLDALATRFGVSRERIYQLEGSARRKIVTALGSDGIIAPNRLAVPPHQSGRRRAAV